MKPQPKVVFAFVRLDEQMPAALGCTTADVLWVGLGASHSLTTYPLSLDQTLVSRL